MLHPEPYTTNFLGSVQLPHSAELDQWLTFCFFANRRERRPLQVFPKIGNEFPEVTHSNSSINWLSPNSAGSTMRYLAGIVMRSPETRKVTARNNSFLINTTCTDEKR